MSEYQETTSEPSRVPADLSGYTIVCGEDYTEAAAELNALLAGEGIELPVRRAADGIPPERTVRIGCPGEELLPRLTWRVACRGDGTVALLCGGPFSAIRCARAFAALRKDPALPAAGDVRPEVPDRGSSDLRIMTANILADRWSREKWLRGCRSVAVRTELFAEAIAATLPDAIGVQESDREWLDRLPEHLDRVRRETGADYDWLFRDVTGRQTLTTILYRRDRYSVRDSGYRLAPYWVTDDHDYQLRMYVWAHLCRIDRPASGFCLVNTHWGIEKERPLDSMAEAETVSDLVGRGVPIFCTGDFNDKPDSGPLREFVAACGLRSARTEAREAGTLFRETDGCGYIDTPRTHTHVQIDHILFRGDLRVDRYDLLSEGAMTNLSDHSPQFADFTLTDIH